MQDILGRELKENDLVLGMIVSRYSDGLRFGVFNGKESINWIKHSYIMTSTVRNVYLVENPSEKELETKQKIITLVEQTQKSKEESEAKRKALKRIPTKYLVIGETYIDDRNSRYIYLGKGNVFDSYTKETKEGYIYLSGYSCKYNKETDEFDYLPSVDILKNPKKLVSVSEDKVTNYIFDKKEFTLKDSWGDNWYYSRRDRSLTFKLEE